MLSDTTHHPILVEICPIEITMPESIQAWLNLLNTQISKNRLLLDCDTNALIRAVEQAIRLNVICTDANYIFDGRINLNFKQQYYYYREMARSSGALTFLCTQHYGAIFRVATSKNSDLKEQWFGKNLSGQYLFGISHAHLRNIISPPVMAIDNKTCYIVNGVLQYVTGYKIFNMLLVGFVSGNKEIFALIPFCESASFIVLKQLSLAAINSTNTVTCQLVEHVIDKSMIVSESPLGLSLSEANQSGRNIIAFHIGLALAAMDLIYTHKYLEIVIVKDTYNFLIKEILNCEEQLFSIAANTSIIPLRIKSLAILNKVFLFGDQILKGAATISDSVFALIKKEAQIFSALASTKDTLIETCNSIISAHWV
ncbi:MAG: hypothetical protein KBD37_04605 [Burkholderiales bacterium]|nr:hypothetical protein [Burkholderiales bacterium]